MAAHIPDTPLTLLKKLTDENASDPQWHRFVTLYTPVIRAWLKLTGLPSSEADDTLQDILLKLVKNLRGQNYQIARSRFRTYLAQIVRSTAIDRLRRKQSQAAQKTFSMSDQDFAILSLNDQSPDIPFQIDAQFQLAVYEAALENLRQDPTLTTLQRFVLHHCILNDTTPTQLAKTSPYSYTQIYRTRSTLQTLLQQRIRLWTLE